MKILNKRNRARIYKTIMVMLFTVMILLLMIGQCRHYRTQYRYSNLEEIELSYWNCKYEIIEEMNGFVQSKVENTNMSSLMLLNLCDKYNIDVRLPLSQGLIESHYGTKGLAFKTNSIFNMGAYDGWKYDKILGIYKYAHPNMSIEPYLKTLSRSYLAEDKTEADLLKNFVNSSGSRYASYKGYESELRLTWAEINSTTRLDSLLREYNYYKLELNR